MQARPRIVIVARRFPEVSQTFVLDHVTGLLERGHKVRVFSEPPPAAPRHADYAASGLAQRTHHWPPWPASLPARLRAAATVLRRLPLAAVLDALRHPQPDNPAIGLGRTLLLRAASLHRTVPAPDLVHAHFGAQGEAFAWLRRHGLLRAPLVVSLHGFDVTRPLAQGLRPYPMLCAHADRIVVTTAFMQAQAQGLGCPPDKIVRLPIGVQVERFAFAERRWQPGETLRLLSIARLVEKKGIAHALRGVASLVREGVALEYRVIGDGPLRESLQALAAELGIAAQVCFEGAQSRETVRHHLAESHLFVFPSCTAADGDQEGQGIVAQEAQACGLPVLATRHGGIPEGVDAGRSAVLVAEADGAAIAAGLRELLQRREQWPEMGRAGRRWVETYFDQRQHQRRLLEIYRELRPDLDWT